MSVKLQLGFGLYRSLFRFLIDSCLKSLGGGGGVVGVGGRGHKRDRRIIDPDLDTTSNSDNRSTIEKCSSHLCS